MSSDIAEAIFYSQMFGGGLGLGGGSWLYVAYLVCLFAVIIYKPERIRNLSMYRRACWFFAISLLLPTVIGLLSGAVLAGTGIGVSGFGRSGMGGAAFGPGGSSLVQWSLRILGSFGPIMFGISVLCALISLVPSFIPPPDHELFGSEPPEPRRFQPPRSPGTSSSTGEPEPGRPIS